MKEYIILFIAIISEVIGTIALKMSDGMSHFGASLIVVMAYGFAFWGLSLALRTFPVGIASAIFYGLGIAGVALVGIIWFKESFDWMSISGMFMIIVGVFILNVRSYI